MSENEITMVDSTSCAVHCADEQQSGSVTAERVPDNNDEKKWNHVFADDGRCPYCGSGDWKRDDYGFYGIRRYRCDCPACGARWVEAVLRTPAPSIPSRRPTIRNTAYATAGEDVQPHLDTQYPLDESRVRKFRIGPHNDIYGEDRETVEAEFAPTRGELIVLAHHYLDRYYIEELCCAMGYGGSTEQRELYYSWSRFCEIERILSPNETNKNFDMYIAQREAEVDEVCREREALRQSAPPFIQSSLTKETCDAESTRSN